MTHERCSELLGGFVRGELSHEDAADVRAHLDGCEECRAEEGAIAALVSSEGVQPLDDMERARLHRGLAQELFTPRANADVAGTAPATPRWTRWVAPALAGAAVLAAVAVMTTTMGGSDDEGGAQVAGRAPAEAGSDETATMDEYGGRSGEADGGGGGKAVRGSAPESSTALESTAKGAASDAAGPLPQLYSDLGSLDASDVPAIGSGFQSFADAYSPGEGVALYDRFLRILRKDAGAAGEEVDECAATLPQDGSLLPAYAALAEYEGEDALLLGFVTSDPGSKEFDRYLIWVWARGSCEQPIDTFFETIGGD